MNSLESYFNPLSTWVGVFSTPNLFFARKFFVLKPISPKFGNLSYNLIQNHVKDKNFLNLKLRSRDMTIFGEWFS